MADRQVSEFGGHIAVDPGSERSFGLVFAVVFAIIGVYPLVGDGGVRVWALVVAGVFLLLALLLPRALAWPNRLWFKLGMLLGAIVAPLVMALVYIVAVLPTGLLFRLAGKDLLRLRFDRNASSYWIKREHPVGSMKNQF